MTLSWPSTSWSTTRRARSTPFPLGDGQNEKHGGEEDYPFPEGMRDLAQESVFEYGSRVGVWRLLRLFEEYDIPVTFSACAMAFELNPAVATAARAAGHDLLSHGWRWEEHWRLSREEEREHIRLAVESFERTWGERPYGYYCRYGPSVNTRELVVEEGGFLYDGDAYNDDYPYFVKVGEHDQLVVPYSLTYNDLQGSRTPTDMLEHCRRALDQLLARGRTRPPEDDVRGPAPADDRAGSPDRRPARVHRARAEQGPGLVRPPARHREVVARAPREVRPVNDGTQDASSTIAEALGGAAPRAIRSDLKSDRVAVELERRILMGGLEPGDRPPTEDALSQMFGVSRSVIRDAVRRLVANGLVTVRQGSGTTVTEPSDGAFGLAALALLARSDLTVGEVISARAMLETALVPLAATTGSEDDWKVLDHALETFGNAVDGGEWDVARDAHLAFHAGLLNALHQPALQLLLRPMTEVIWMSSEPPSVTEPADWEVETHPPILIALKARDPAAVAVAVREHYAVLDEAARYGTYRSSPFRSVFESEVLNESIARR